MIYMENLDNSPEVTFYVQWALKPFPHPQIDIHKIANTKEAIKQTKEVLETILEQFDGIIIASDYNGKVKIIIEDPKQKDTQNNQLWNIILSTLKNCSDIIYISVFVNNDISEMIAINNADLVNKPYHTGYTGTNNETLIYHK